MIFFFFLEERTVGSFCWRSNSCGKIVFTSWLGQRWICLGYRNQRCLPTKWTSAHRISSHMVRTVRQTCSKRVKTYAMLMRDVWRFRGLCDTCQTGKLNKEQFAIAMWLIKQKLNGIDPPAELTPEMTPPSLRKTGETIVVKKHSLLFLHHNRLFVNFLISSVFLFHTYIIYVFKIFITPTCNNRDKAIKFYFA